MIPAVSTRVFGRLPGVHELLLAHRYAFYDLELWGDDLVARPDAVDAFARAARDAGVRVPCFHLPLNGPHGPIDLHTRDAGLRADAIGWLDRALDDAARLGAQYVVAHVRGDDDAGVATLVDRVNNRQLVLALEADTLPHSSPAELCRLLERLGAPAYRHGLCIDLSRTDAATVTDPVRRRLRWVEVSACRNGRSHDVPVESDVALRRAVERFYGLPYVAYEVVSFHPGEAELSLVLRRLNAWHRGGAGVTRFEGPVVPF